MYHMHDSFGRRTELLMHDLAGAATSALQMSTGILGALDGMDARMAGKARLYRPSLRRLAGKRSGRCAGRREAKENILRIGLAAEGLRCMPSMLQFLQSC